MVIVKIYGGLGNQMFQYAFYKSLCSYYSEVYTDTYSFKPSWVFDEVKLSQVFENVLIDDRQNLKSIKLIPKNNLITRVMKFLHLNKKIHFYEKSFLYNDLVFNLNGDIYFEGYWQTEKYFFDIQEQIRHSFKFRTISDDKNLKFLHQIVNEESVSIHIRKGKDYLNNPLVFNTCELEYYSNAIKIIKEKVDSPRFYIFSDNPDWVLEHLNFLDFTIVDWNSTIGKNNYVDMQLMSNCKHNIIANSSYSWWGAWLNENNEKIVICPRRWFNSSKKRFNTRDLTPSTWISL